MSVPIYESVVALSSDARKAGSDAMPAIEPENAYTQLYKVSKVMCDGFRNILVVGINASCAWHELGPCSRAAMRNGGVKRGRSFMPPVIGL